MDTGKYKALRVGARVVMPIARGRDSKPCRQCGDTIGPLPRSVLAKKAYCSLACLTASQVKWPPKQCATCGGTFRRRPGGAEIAEGRDTAYCSKSCYGASLRAAAEARKESLPPPDLTRALRRRLLKCLRAIAKHKGGQQGVCSICGVAYERALHERRSLCPPCGEVKAKAARKRAAAKGRKTPQHKARKVADKAKRRARKRIASETIIPSRVFDRDGWKCQLCKRPTPKRLRGSYEPNAPELDHIVALADGGGHTWGNVQCACRACNSGKGAKAMGQLGLGFGV